MVPLHSLLSCEIDGCAGAKHRGWRTIHEADHAQPLACKVYVGGLPVVADGKKTMATDVANHVKAVMPAAFLAGVHMPPVRPIAAWLKLVHTGMAYTMQPAVDEGAVLDLSKRGDAPRATSDSSTPSNGRSVALDCTGVPH